MCALLLGRSEQLRGRRAFDHFAEVEECHLIGTARMGPVTDPTAVVDDQLRVHGMQSLRVADASIMPSMLRWLWRDYGVSTDVHDKVERSLNAPGNQH